MGQTLSEPVVEKASAHGEDDRFIFGLSAMQGWRITMEDSHAAVLDLKSKDSEKPTASDQRLSFFGVYDGHGGDKVAHFAGDNIHTIIAKQEAYRKGEYDQALKDGFLAVDRAILNDPMYSEEVSGCTASVALLSKSKIYVGNAGDSRTVLGIKGRAKPLSFDHKPQNEGEKARIVAAGGFVDFGRVNGNLALSRAIGDFEFKKSADLSPEQQIVTAYPDVVIHDISDDDEFLIIACDGIWDCQSSQAVVEFVRRGVAAKQELHKVCENMMDNCCASSTETGGVGCDNMTMIVVGLLNGRTKEEWYDLIATRVANGDGPCAPPEYGKFFLIPFWSELRGPGTNTQFRDDSPDDFDQDLDHRMRDLGRPQGRIIILGDGTEIMAGSGDAEMFDHDEEDRDLDSQVIKGSTNLEQDRSEREGTPGPNATHNETSNGKAFDEPTSQNVKVNHNPINSEDSKLGTTTA